MSDSSMYVRFYVSLNTMRHSLNLIYLGRNSSSLQMYLVESLLPNVVVVPCHINILLLDNVGQSQSYFSTRSS